MYLLGSAVLGPSFPRRCKIWTEKTSTSKSAKILIQAEELNEDMQPNNVAIQMKQIEIV